MKKEKTISEWVLNFASDVFNALLTIIKFCLGGGLTPDIYDSAEYWRQERDRERRGYYDDHR